MPSEPPAFCPACGARVPAKALACPSCGSDEQTGWSEEAHADSLGIPSDDFDYERFADEEFGAKKSEAHKLPWYWWFVGVGLLLLLLRYAFHW